MKRKNLLILFLATALVGLPSCGSSSIESVKIPYGRLYDDSLASSNDHFYLIDHAKLTSKISQKDDFVLLVYKKNDTCGCWVNSFRPNILKYMKERNAAIYAINYTEFGDGVSKFGLTVSSSDQTIGVFENGSLRYSRVRNGEDDEWAVNYDTFSSWMDSRIEFGDSIYINQNQLGDLYDGDGKFVIGWMRESCGDCGYIARNSLKEWAKGKHEGTLYLFDCDDPSVRPFDDDGNLDTATWQLFKDTHGFSEKGNDDFGFEGGYVPTFHYVDPTLSALPNKCISDGMVVFNDTIGKNDDGYYVKSSYFSEDRIERLAFLDLANESVTKILEGIKLDSSDVTVYQEYGGYISWNHSSAEKYYAPLLNQFLNYYLG